MFTIIGPDATAVPASTGLIWSMIAISLAIVLAFYALRSIGLYVMAKKQGVNKAFIAFIPLVWMYIACKLIGNVRFFGKTFDKLAIIFCILFSVGEFLALAYEFIVYLPVISNFLAGNELYMVLITDKELYATHTQELTRIWGNFNIYGGKDFVNPYTQIGLFPETLNPIMSVIYYLSMVLDIVIIVITVTVYINLFRKYYPQHFILFAVLSWMGIFAPLVFAVRNRQPVNYNDYIRSRYNAWYAGGNPYGGQNPQQPPRQDVPPTPFEEFAEKDEIDPGDPFGEFSSKEDKNDR